MFPTLNSVVNNECVIGGVPGPGSGLHHSRAIINTPNHHYTPMDYFVMFTRFWAIFSATVLGGVGIDLIYHSHKVGYYHICGSLALLLLETLWVITAFLKLNARAECRVWKYWCKVSWFEGWKKSVLYAPMGAVSLLWPQKLWLSYVAAGQIIVLAFFHFILSFKGRRRRRKRKDRLLHGDVDSCESSKFEDVTDVLDDGGIVFPEPIPGSSHSIADSLAEQDSILEI